jgi:hypothetical protein
VPLASALNAGSAAHGPGVSMSEHSLASSEAAVVEAPPVEEALTADRRTLWDAFGKMLFGNVLVIAIVLILMAIFLV